MDYTLTWYFALESFSKVNTIKYKSNMYAFLSFDLFMVYIPECKQQIYTQIRYIAHFKSEL